MESIGQRIWTAQGEKARELGFRSKQRMPSKDAAFVLSLLDAVFADPSLRMSWQGLEDIIPYLSSYPDRQSWLSTYWSFNYINYLGSIKPGIFDQHFRQSASLIINNNCSAPVASPVGVAQSGSYFFALYKTGLQEELIPLDCGHFMSSDMVMPKEGTAREFTENQLSQLCSICSQCGSATQTLKLFKLLNRTEEWKHMDTSIAPVAPVAPAVRLKCGYHIVADQLLSVVSFILENQTCVCGQHSVMPEDYMTAAVLHNSQREESREASLQCVKMPLCSNHSPCQSATWTLHKYCYYCNECCQRIQNLLQEGQGVKCQCCCGPITTEDLQRAAALGGSGKKEQPTVYTCSKCNCSTQDALELIACGHTVCNSCAIVFYLSELQQCPCGAGLDANDCCTISVLYFSSTGATGQPRVVTRPPQYCRNHKEGSPQIPGHEIYKESLSHYSCFPCDQCLRQQLENRQSCLICYASLSAKDLEHLDGYAGMLFR